MNGTCYLTLAELLQLYEAVMEASGGSPGVVDLGLIESALAQPRATFGDQELYSDLPTKAAALGYSLITNQRMPGERLGCTAERHGPGTAEFCRSMRE